MLIFNFHFIIKFLISKIFLKSVSHMENQVLKVLLYISVFIETSSATFEITEHFVISGNITDRDSAVYNGGKWLSQYTNTSNSGVLSVNQPGGYLAATFTNGCLRTLDSNECNMGSNTSLGLTFWVRYKGFISDIFGDISEYHVKLGELLSSVTSNKLRWINCFNSRHHGWNMEEFHKRCDNKGPTVSLFKVREDAIFGGFTTAEWGGSTAGYKYADQGFLFTIKNVDGYNLPIMNLKDKDKAVYNDPQKGPSFGDKDLVIPNAPNIEGSSSSSLGTSYSSPPGFSSTDSKTLLAGSSSFGLTNMEVFYMECFNSLGMEREEIPDSSITGSVSFDVKKVRLGVGSGVYVGQYLQIQLNTLSLISGFTVQSSLDCGSFNIIYDSNGMKDYIEDSMKRKFQPGSSGKATTFVLKTAISSTTLKFSFTLSSVPNTCTFAVEIYGCNQDSVCEAALGMQSKVIKDYQITASHEKDHNHKAIYGRANLQLGDKGCWKSSKGNYLQIDLQVQKIITQIGIQSCHKEDHYPESFSFSYSKDGVVFHFYRQMGPSNRTYRTYYTNSLGRKIKKFPLFPPVVAQKIRIYPVEKTEMRVELYGCLLTKALDQPTTLLSTGEALSQNIGFDISIAKNVDGGNILKGMARSRNGKLDVSFKSGFSVAQWKRVTFLKKLSGIRGNMFMNNFMYDGSMEYSSGYSRNSTVSALIVDHSSIPWSNVENIQISDILVFKTSLNDSQKLLKEISKKVDGEFYFNSLTIPDGSADVPLVIEKGWQPYQGCTPSGQTGPCTGSSGNPDPGFLYLETSAPAVKGKTAILKSFYLISAYRCFIFNYFMRGANIGRLNFYVQDAAGSKELLWRLVGNQGSQWNVARVPLNRKRPFRGIIEAIAGNGFLGDIAIDGIRYRTNTCLFHPALASIALKTGFVRSNIIGTNTKYQDNLMLALAEVGIEKRFWKPCYQTSRNDTKSQFWSTCSSRGPTVTIVRYQNNVIVGFSDRDWPGTSSGVQVTYSMASSKAFILSLSNPSSQPKKFQVNNIYRHEAIKIDKSKGPIFGSALEVDGLSVKTVIGKEYGKSSDPESYLTGKTAFTANEVEVLYQGDHPCDDWCALKGWTCDEINGKCECKMDRNWRWCYLGFPQAFLGTCSNESLALPCPASWWDLDTHPILYDLIAGKTAEVTSPAATQVQNGLSQKALKLDGSANIFLGSYKDTCLLNSQRTGNTISLWLKYGNNTGSGSQTFFTFGDDSNGGALLKVLQDNPFSEEISVIENFGKTKTSSLFQFPWNVWSHLVITWSFTNSLLEVYRNGQVLQPMSPKVICSDCSISNAENVYIGEKNVAPVTIIDEIGMWCRPLTKQQVQEVFRFYQGPGGFMLRLELQFTQKDWSSHKDSESPEFQAVQNDVISKIQNTISSAEVSNVQFECRGPSKLACFVSFGVNESNANTILSIYDPAKVFGSDVILLSYMHSAVPLQWPVLDCNSTIHSDIVCKWNIPEDELFGIYQWYNITCFPQNDLSLSVSVAEERYMTSLVLSNLTAYTPYSVTLLLGYLGDVYTSVNKIVWTMEKAPYGPPLNVRAVTAGSRCLNVRWKDPAQPIHGLVLGFNLTYQPVNHTIFSSVITHQSNLSLYTYKLCGLQPSSIYDIGVAAFTGGGTGPFAIVQGATSERGPDTAPGNLTSFNATFPYDDTSTCFISWNSPSPDTYHGNLTSYRIVYTNLANNETVYAEIGACNTSIVLKQLRLYTKYHVIVAASNQRFYGPYSRPVYCFTNGTVPAAPPTNLRAVGASSTSCRITWGPVPLEFRNGLILGYNITYLKVGDPDTELKFSIVKAPSNNTELSGLLKYTNYSLTISAFTNKGQGNQSSYANAECQTLEGAPDDVPSNLKVDQTSKVSCSVSWTAIPKEKANGVIRGYDVAVFDTNTTYAVLTQITCDCFVTVPSLRPFRLYNITVRGFNSMAMSNGSTIQCMTDEDMPLSAPPNITCQAKTSTIIEVCWDEIPIEQRQGIVRSHRILYELLNQTANGPVTDIANASSALCWNVTDLDEFSEYAFKVKAVTVKEGNFSETPIKCMTMEGLPKTAPENITGNNITAYEMWVAHDGVSVQPPGILRSYVYFYRIHNASEDTTRNISFPAITKNITLDKLLLFTNYCIQVAAFTVGVGPRSDCTYILTDDKWLPPPDGIPPYLIQEANSTTKNCYLEWGKTNNSNPDPDGRVIGYTLFYKPANTNDTEKEEEVEGVNTTSYVLKDLEEFTKYEIRVAARNIYGAGNTSVLIYCFTKEDAPSQAPVDVKGSNSSSTSISINWSEIPTNDKNGIIRQMCIFIYEVKLGNSSGITLIISYEDNSSRRRRAISIDPTTKVITGLKKFTEYAIQVYGVTVAAGPLSPVIYVTTAEDVPSAPVTNLTVKNSSSSSLFLTWSNVPEANRHGIIRFFVIFYWKTDWPIVEMKNVTLPIDMVRIKPNATKFKFNMTGLEIWTNYTIQVAGFTVGAGARTNETTVSTDEDRPCLPPNYVLFDVPRFGSLEVIWTKVLRHCRNGIIRGYRLIYQEIVPGSIPVIVNFTASQYNYIIENMNMEVNYTVQVLAFTRIGDGNATYDLARPDKLGPRSTPINVTASNFTTPHTIVVKWRPISDPAVIQKLLGYKVAWRMLSEGSEDMEDAPWNRYTVRKDTLSTTIKGLTNFGRYQIEISGFTRGGFGPSGVTFGETCRCSKRITTNYRIFSPYNSVQISRDRKKVNMSGMIPKILNDLTLYCCQTCKAHGGSYVDFVQNGKNLSAFQLNEKDVIDLIDDSNDLSFPVYGWKWQDRYQEIYRYIPLVESPGFAFLLLEPETEAPLKAIMKSIIETWPYLLVTVVMAQIAGIIIWFMDTAYNEEQFPHSYFKGIANGWWWAFISMTTLGYGDKVPAANHSKAFAVIWVLTGLVVYGILSGSICTAFTTVIYKSSTQLYGAKVGAIYDTPEYRFGVRRSAQVNTEANYSNFEEILQALLDRKVDGILMDAYEAGTKSKQFSKTGKTIRIHKVYNYASTFGVVIAGPSTRLYQCSRNWMSANRAEMTAHIAKYMEVVEEENVNELVEITTGLFNAESEVFQSFIRFSLIVFGIFLALGIIWELYYYTRKKKLNKLQMSSDSNARKTLLVEELGGFTMNFLEEFQTRLTDLRAKHKDELRKINRSSGHGKKGNLIGLDMLLKENRFH